MTHQLLERQLKKLGIDADTPPNSSHWAKFLEQIDNTYQEADQDRYLLERSLAISSKEMQQLYENLKQASELRYRHIFEGVQDAIIVLSPDGCIMDANHKACELFDRSLDDLTQLNFAELECQGNQPGSLGWLPNDDAPTSTIVSADFRINGNVLPVEITSSQQKIGDEEVILAVIRDVSDRKQSEAAMARRAAELSILNEISGKIAGVLDLDSLLHRTVELIQKNFKLEHVAIFLINPEEETLVMQARSGVYADSFPDYHTLKIGQGIVGWVAEVGASLLVGDVRKEKRYVNFYPNKVNTLSELSLPIIASDRVLGVLDIQSQEKDAFSDHDLVVMGTLVDQIAVAIDNAHLYEELQRELTERQQVLEALRHSEANHRAVFEGVHDGIIVESMTGEVLDVNSRACEMYGWSKEEFLAKKISDLFPTGSFAIMPEELKRSAQQETAFETVNIRADGSHFHAEVAARLQTIGDKLVMLVLVRDITERKTAEEELLRSQQRLQILYDYSPDGYYLTDLKGTFIDGNAAAEKIVGYPKEELIGKTLLDTGLLTKKDIPRAANLLGKNVVGQPTGPDIFELNRKDGSQVTVEISTYPVKLDQKTVVLGIARNITERLEAEAAMRESEERFRSVAETAVDAVVILDGKGHVRYWNKAAEVIFGYTIGEVHGKKVDLIIPGEYLNLHDLGTQQVLGTVESQEIGRPIELHGKRKNGEEFPLELSLASWRTPGGEFTSAIIRDVSAKRDAQRRSQLQDRLAAVGQLAAGIAHDFNNILGTIILYSELMLKSDALPPKDRDRLATIFKQAERGAHLTAQILDFGRKSVMEQHHIDLVPFFEDLGHLLSRTLPENVQLDFNFDRSNHYFIDADPTRLQQVIMNLALNSRDAMPNGGELKFDIELLDVDSVNPPYRDMPSGPWVRIRVIDTGEGIPPDILPHIFEPFFTTKAQGEGTGLGLAQVYGIVKQHGGYIEADSEISVGTTFIIYLPAVPEPAISKVDAETEPTRAGTGETVLVVEDDEATRMAICEILGTMGYQVLNVADGLQALNTLEVEHERIRLIISDLVMPNLGGRDLYDLVVDRYPRIKMIIMTGYPLGTHTRELLDRRRVFWLQKPLTSDTLSQAVQEMLK